MRSVAEQNLYEGHGPGELLLDIGIEGLRPGTNGNRLRDEHTTVLMSCQHQAIQMILRASRLESTNLHNRGGAVRGVRANNERRFVYTVETLLQRALQDELLLC